MHNQNECQLFLCLEYLFAILFLIVFEGSPPGEEPWTIIPGEILFLYVPTFP